MRSSLWNAIAACVLLSFASGCIAAAVEGDKPPRTVVAIIEPLTSAPGSTQPNYSVSIGGVKQSDGLQLLNALGKERGTRLVMLVHQSVPIGAAWALAASASKAGYLEYGVYVFDSERTTMTSLPAFKSIKFSTDPAAVIN